MGILSSDTGGPVAQPSLHELVELLPTLVSEDPLAVAVALRDRFGYVVRIPPLHPALDADIYLVSHPDDIEFVLQSDPTKFRGLDAPGTQDFSRVVRNSIVSLTPDSEEGSWIKRLRMLNPEFSEAVVEDHVPRLSATTLATLEEFTDGSGQVTAGDPRTVPDAARVWTPEVDGVRLLPAMRRLTLRLLGVSLFGPDMRAHEVAVIDAVDTLRSLFKDRQLHLVTSYVTRRLPDELHLPRWLQEPLGVDPYIEFATGQEREIEAAVQTLKAAADAVVSRREQAPLVFDDALGEWLRRSDPVTGDRLEPDTLRQEVMGLLIAGHATMSAGLAWAFYCLAAHPEVQQRIHDEARATPLLSRPATLETEGIPDSPEAACHPVDGPDFLDALPETRRVWQETLRLYPPLPFFGRTTREAVSLGEATLEPDTHVLLSPYVTHRDGALWDEPGTFDPDRFTDARMADRPNMAYFPFSAGPHACLGRTIAMTEALVVLATTMATHRIEFVGPDADGPHDGPAVGLDSAINLQPDREILVRFVTRD